MTKKVYIMRGVPGSGKTTHAKKLVDPSWDPGSYISADDFFDRGGVYQFTIEDLGRAHDWCLSSFASDLARSISPIIVDNTNTKLWELAPYALLARAMSYEVEIIHVKRALERCITTNVHWVPEQTIRRMAEQFEPLPLNWLWCKQTIVYHT